MRLKTRRNIKVAARWAAFFILASSLILAVSLGLAIYSNAPAQAGWAIGKLLLPIAAFLAIAGYLEEK